MSRPASFRGRPVWFQLYASPKWEIAQAITKRAVVLDTPDGDVIAIRPVMNMVLAIDHRANDGAQAAAFLRTIKTWLEAVGPDTPIF